MVVYVLELLLQNVQRQLLSPVTKAGGDAAKRKQVGRGDQQPRRAVRIIVLRRQRRGFFK